MRKFFLALVLIPLPAFAGTTALEDGAAALSANALCDAGFTQFDIDERLVASSRETGVRNLKTLLQMMTELSAQYTKTMLEQNLVREFCSNIDKFQINQKRSQRPMRKTF